MQRLDLAEELFEMVADDEKTRDRLTKDPSFWHGYHPEMRVVHRRNGDRFDALLDEIGGWPGYQLVGPDGSKAAWLIAIHDISNPTLMRRARDLMRVAVTDGQASPANLATLVDRIRMYEGSAQMYGTQLGFDDDGVFGTWPPVDDSDNVDERRAKVGLGPLAAVLVDRRSDPTRPQRMSPEEVADLRQREAEFLRSAGWRSRDEPSE